MSILKLKASYKDYIWGGHRLVEEYGEDFEGDVLAEAWKLSCHKDGSSIIINGDNAGLTLKEYIEKKGRGVLGTNSQNFEDFPILIKFIDAKNDLSIQVHPRDGYALANEGQYGKTEMWYVMDAAEDAFLYHGFEKDISKEEFEARIKDNTLTEVLHKVPVKKGDYLHIEAGTIHAIGKNILIAEIQQNSNVTYRVFDYGRKDKNGNSRELHIGKALDVTDRKPARPNIAKAPHLADCKYFTVDKAIVTPAQKYTGEAASDSFVSVLVLEGEGVVEALEEKIEFRKGDSLLLEAGTGKYTLCGEAECLITSIPGGKDKIRVGVDIGGTDVKIALVDSNQEFVATDKIETLKNAGAEDIVNRITDKIKSMLSENGKTVEDCTGIGVGMPGTIDTEQGSVIYSNNIPWENVPLADMIRERIDLPVRVANDADCAALGESAVGAGANCKSFVMLTLGTGVGSGLIVNGSIYDGSGLGGNEFGHMLIEMDGRPCTCGGRGCLEAYASATALRNCSKEVYGVSKEPLEIFNLADDGDEYAVELVEDYIKFLGAGVLNITNMLRPKRFVFGGGIAAQGERLLGPIREMLKEKSFGGKYAEVPELKVATLGNKAGMIGAANLFDY